MRENNLEQKYNPKDFEEKIYERWEKGGCFKPSDDKTKTPYCITMPPPNITGKLHMGHALDDTIQDVLIRYKRMDGFNTLWLPGTDHASISTEAKIVAKMKEEGLRKSDIGREEFLKRAWEWKEEFGGAITNQVRKLGCSCDWSRERFTLDAGLSDAVLKVFKKLYDKGLIYKGKRMINWCPCCNTSISDVEIEYKEEATHLWHLRYKVVGTEDQYVIVATTRPETMLGDTAVAVHPDDERYTDLVGKKVILPIMNKEIPIVADRFVEKEFGTGAVKVTPAHDMNDYQAGINNNLEIVEVFDDNFKMNNLVPEYEGLDIYEARKLIVKKLEEIGALIKTEDYVHNVAKCDRCHATIEPKISIQWFVKMEELAKPAIEEVRKGSINFVPQRYDKTYFHWLENIQDWCISRQLWWGHRIPAYYCDECGHINVEEHAPEKCEKCGGTHLTQDEDTLDTWFSSALWPFSTLGWPNETEDLKYFYPTNTLVTAYDIINCWVSRMIFSGLEQMDKKPFDTVLIHGIVRDSLGRKMSKSLGNGIDPLDIIEKYGTDALRFSLILGISPGNDIRYIPEKLELASNFANKIWNAAKFIIMNIDSDEEILEFSEKVYNKETRKFNEELLNTEDKWLINKLDVLIKEVNKNLESFELGVALEKIYNFMWDEFCDWYIEMVKPRLYNKEDKTRISAVYTLDYVFGVTLKLLHPFMPFITTKIYPELVKYNEKELMLSKWPKAIEKLQFEKEENQIEEIKKIITEIRNLRASMNVPPSKKTKLIFVTKTMKQIIEDAAFLEKLGFADEIIIQEDRNSIPQNALSILTSEIEVFIPAENLIDVKEEKERLLNEKEKVVSEIERATKMLSNEGFVSKAPAKKIEEEKEKLEKYKEMLNKIEERLKSL